MTITLKDLKHLEVMGTLENAAPRKAPEINIKELIADKTDRELTLNEKIVSLCTKLRTDGFDKQAESLESKFLAYKAASTHLYRTHDEDGEDLIDFAHPDGDVKVEDATKELGHVETVLSRHKKIVDVVNKTPTGKLASKYSDALKYITAQNVDELSNVNLQEIAKKFQYMADYLKKYFTTNMPEGSTLEPAARNFYGLLGAWQELAQTIATELNHNQEMPITQAMQLVKNRLQNGFSNAQQYVTKVNHVSDVDKLVSWILSWAEENNPMKKNASLHNYLNKVVVAQPIDPTSAMLYGLYKTYKAAKMVFGDLKDKSEEMVSKLENLRDDSDASKFPELTKKINAVITAAQKVIAQHERLEMLQGSPRGKAVQLLQAKKFFERFAEMLADLKLTVENVHKAVENSMGSKVYHLFVMSNFTEAKMAIKSVLDAANSFVATLGSLEDEASKAPTGDTKDPSLDFGEQSNSAEVGIAQLKDWANALPAKSNISDDKKQQGLIWIKQQMKEFEDNKSNPEKINQLMKENKAFQDEWMK